MGRTRAKPHAALPACLLFLLVGPVAGYGDEAPHPPIAVPFDLPEPAFVTLVIEDADGHRVRNLVADQFFPAGHQIAWWDGTDDLGRDPDAAAHGVYHVPGRLVAPGAYRVRGLAHGAIDLRYEFSVYTPGDPPWPTEDHRGGWLADHTPPTSALFVPENGDAHAPLVYLGSPIAEWGAGLAWVDLDGRKQGGRRAVSGIWIGAAFLARDEGPERVAAHDGYAAGFLDGKLQVVALENGDGVPIATVALEPAPRAVPDEMFGPLHGLAARDGVLAISLSPFDQIRFIDARSGATVGQAAIADPRGLAFAADGHLLVLSGTALLRCDLPRQTFQPRCTTLIGSGLEDPQGIALDSTGHIYVSDWGDSHQVKVFAQDGRLERTIGTKGAPRAGPYDESHMNHPMGLTIDSRGHLWVAEADLQPKRVSVWSADGTLWRAFYGPSRYGGGGAIDGRDKTRFYLGGMELRLDWQAGTSRVVAILDRIERPEPRRPFADRWPEQAIHLGGRQYMTNAYNENGTDGAFTAVVWLLRDGLAVPVAALGRLSDLPALQSEDLGSRLPSDVNRGDKDWRRGVVVAWFDRDGDGLVEPDELQFIKGIAGGVTVMPDLSFIVSRIDDRMLRFRPTGFAADGAPLYDWTDGELLAADAQPRVSTGGDWALITPEGWLVASPPPRPFAPQSLGGGFGGAVTWSYPSLWPGLHASHAAPVPDRPGELVGTTRLLGGTVTPRGGDAGSLWAVNGNLGEIYLFTYDGLFVAALFKDVRSGRLWAMPTAERGMLLDDVSPHDECFWPTLTQTEDGAIYLQAGFHSAIVRIDGLDSIRRLPVAEIAVTPEDLRAAADYVVDVERLRQAQAVGGTLAVALRDAAPRLDPALADWPNADWVTIDASGVPASYEDKSKPYAVAGAVAIAGDRLYAAFRTGDAGLLRNSGEMPAALFATGGALDLMIGADPEMADDRRGPAQGDERLIVTKIGDRPVARLYRQVASEDAQHVAFSSPWRTVSFDQVEDVSDQVRLAAGDGNYVFSIPLATLGLAPRPGMEVRGDIGVLRGNGFVTVQRAYWHNKATTITADIPSEAELTPQLWGHWRFVRQPGG
jgi:hypothetical protein